MSAILIKELAVIADTSIKLAAFVGKSDVDQSQVISTASMVEVKSAEHEANDISCFDGIGVWCLTGTGK